MNAPTQPQPIPDLHCIPDLHFAADPMQVGEQIMVRIQVCDNFGVSFQLVMPPKIVIAFSKMLRDAASQAETTLVKPQSTILPS